MDIPIEADVNCADGPGGRSTYVVISPLTQQLTHVVVKEHRYPYAQRLVSVDDVLDSTPTSIQLRCTCDALSKLQRFIESEYLEGIVSFRGCAREAHVLWPYTASELTLAEHKQAPPSELALHRGTAIYGTDGRVGKVDEFVIEPETKQITYMVLAEGHVWGQKDVTIPVSEIEHIEDEAIYLKLDKLAIGQLPPLTMRR